MDKLTWYDNDGRIMCRRGYEVALARLASYEATGLTPEQVVNAKTIIESAFADDVSKELPLEYAVEMNNLIQLEMKGSIG